MLTHAHDIDPQAVAFAQGFLIVTLSEGKGLWPKAEILRFADNDRLATLECSVHERELKDFGSIRLDKIENLRVEVQVNPVG